MKKTFLAYDNTSFDTEDECLEHEANNLAYRMYDGDGDVTYDHEDAKVIYVYPCGASKLLDDLEQADCSYCGISYHSSGWFLLCDDCNEWNHIPDELIKLFRSEEG